MEKMRLLSLFAPSADNLNALSSESYCYRKLTYFTATMRKIKSTQKIKSKLPAVAADMKAMAQADRRYGQTLSTHDDWCRMQSEWFRFQEASLTPEQQRERQTHFEQGLADLLTTTGNTSNLILDPQMDSNYTMDTCIAQIPQIVIATGQTNAAATRRLRGEPGV